MKSVFLAIAVLVAACGHTETPSASPEGRTELVVGVVFKYKYGIPPSNTNSRGSFVDCSVSKRLAESKIDALYTDYSACVLRRIGIELEIDCTSPCNSHSFVCLKPVRTSDQRCEWN